MYFGDGIALARQHGLVDRASPFYEHCIAVERHFVIQWADAKDIARNELLRKNPFLCTQQQHKPKPFSHLFFVTLKLCCHQFTDSSADNSGRTSNLNSFLQCQHVLYRRETGLKWSKHLLHATYIILNVIGLLFSFRRRWSRLPPL